MKLGRRPEIIAVTKCELPEADTVRDALAQATGQNVLSISAVTGKGLDRLLHAIVAALDQIKQQ